MPKLAIDTSTAAQWQLSEESEAERARYMLHDYAAAQVAFVAPLIWHYEVANVVNKAVVITGMSPRQLWQGIPAPVIGT